MTRQVIYRLQDVQLTGGDTRAQRRFVIELSFDKTVGAMSANLKRPCSFSGVALFDFLVTYVRVQDIESIAWVTHHRFWKNPDNRLLLAGELKLQLYYLVARLTRRLGVNTLPERLKVTPAQGEMIRQAALRVLHEVFSSLGPRIRGGLLVSRNLTRRRGGDRAMDRKLFSRIALHHGLIRVLNCPA
ncbi:MAG: hypothetical protein QNK37_08875 [Acidobacteriota bacterium]|nr:hypothetical protein [Acidobacteriota bacterium]